MSRFFNLFRRRRLEQDIDEELQAHLAEAAENGRDPLEARRAFGPALRLREDCTEAHLLPWLDSLRADAILAARHIAKHKVLSLSVVLSLGLAIGASSAAFRLVDALLLRPLPVEKPEQLFVLAKYGTDLDGKPRSSDSWNYPLYQLLQRAAGSEAQLAAASYAGRVDVSFSDPNDPEKAGLQYVSGNFFSTLGLRPALGRLLGPNDNVKPEGHPVAVLAHRYWTRRFQSDPAVLGRTFTFGKTIYQIVGVAEAPFTGTEPGFSTDLFVPTAMHGGFTKNDWTWFRTLARIQPSVPLEPLRARLDATSRHFEELRLRPFANQMTPQALQRFLDTRLQLDSASAGASRLQRDFRLSLLALCVLVGLVLLIACANVANLLTAQSTARAHELALRVSIGAGRARLLQLVLVECALLGLAAAVAGALFSAWAAPFVLSFLSNPNSPLFLDLPYDLRLLAFSSALTLLVVCLFGAAPALRASAVRPSAVLRAGLQGRSRHLQMRALVALQVTFCFLVLFLAGLFVSTSRRLANQPLGFDPQNLLVVYLVSTEPRPAAVFDQLAADLRNVPGVQSTALASWALLNGNSWNGFISTRGATHPTLAQFLGASPAWLDSMRLPLLRGRMLGPNDVHPGAAVINQTFANTFFPNEDPLGRTFSRPDQTFEIVGIMADAPYRSLREPIPPVALFSLHETTKDGKFRDRTGGTLLVRTAGAPPSTLIPALTREIRRLQPGIRVSQSTPHAAIVDAQTVRERLLAVLALFFAAVAILLAAVGLYGVLDYAVLQRRRDIGIRLAIGARPVHLAWNVLAPHLAMVLLGAAAGLGLGLYAARSVDTLLYNTKSTEPALLALPWAVVALSSAAASLPALRRALRLDPLTTLRAE